MLKLRCFDPGKIGKYRVCRHEQRNTKLKYNHPPGGSKGCFYWSAAALPEEHSANETTTAAQARAARLSLGKAVLLIRFNGPALFG